MKNGRLLIRTIVKDIVNILKNKKSGFFYLPKDGDFYSIGKFPVKTAVELTLKRSTKTNSFMVNAFYSLEDDVVEILVLFNPKTLEKNMYDIIGELNEVVTHELQHSIQNYRGELDNDENTDDLTPLEYYLQPEELDAQAKGFKRISKLRKIPAILIMKKWFEKHITIHNLTEDEQQMVMNSILEKM